MLHKKEQNLTQINGEAIDYPSDHWFLAGSSVQQEKPKKNPKARKESKLTQNGLNLATKKFRTVFQQRINLLHNPFDRETGDVPSAEHTLFLHTALLPFSTSPVPPCCDTPDAAVAAVRLWPFRLWCDTSAVACRWPFFLFGRFAGLVPPHCAVFLPELIAALTWNALISVGKFDTRGLRDALCCGRKSTESTYGLRGRR